MTHHVNYLKNYKQLKLNKMEERKNLPTISDLYDINSIEKTFKHDQLLSLLNQEPQQKWVKTNKFANDSQYIPIGIIETLLQRIFKNIKIEVIEYKQLFNSISCQVRVHYTDPITGEWRFHDGVGACELQTKKDTGVLMMDFSNINKSAIEIALPKAKSQAIKDACEHFGKLFGRDINRKETMNYQMNTNIISSSNPITLDENGDK